MIILAFETSCDDTSLAIFEDDRLLAMNTASQIKINNETRWVVPEVAAREHANNIFGVLDTVLEESGLKLEDIDYIWVTSCPGLLTSLLTGVSVASTLSTVLKKSIIPIHHIEAHIFSNFLEREEEDITFPLVCLTVSGGHNDLYYMGNMWNLEKLWSSQDDAGWEAFDKVAKMMDLEYPGGPIISKLASEYEKEWWQWSKLFPRVWLKKDEFNFSFSWLKSSVKREVDKRILEKWRLSLEDKKEIAFEFENAVVEVLAYKLINSAKQKWVQTVLLAGWVSANNRLRSVISELAEEEWFEFLYPAKNVYCMDNAAMVGINTYYKVKYGRFEEKVGVVEI